MIFFRNDDVGQDHPRFMRLATLFSRHGQKLNGAAVPMDCKSLSPTELSQLRAIGSTLELHVHGFRHENHQPAGEKKAEYGSARSILEVTQELRRGKQIINQLFPEFFYPAFTPPWNRIADQFLPLLQANGFQILSRFANPKLGANTGRHLPELNVAIDLHTSKEGNVPTLLELTKLASAAEAEQKILGIMLHHTKMDEEQFAYIDTLLPSLNNSGVKAKFFSELEKHVRRPATEGADHASL